MKAIFKISVFLTILVADLVFFIPIEQYFPETYEWAIVTASYLTGISADITGSLFVIVGFAVALLCVPAIFYLVYGSLKRASRIREIGGN